MAKYTRPTATRRKSDPPGLLREYGSGSPLCLANGIWLVGAESPREAEAVRAARVRAMIAQHERGERLDYEAAARESLAHEVRRAVCAACGREGRQSLTSSEWLVGPGGALCRECKRLPRHRNRVGCVEIVLADEDSDSEEVA